MKPLTIPELLALIPVLADRDTHENVYKRHKVLLFTLQISEDELNELMNRANQATHERNDYYDHQQRLGQMQQQMQLNQQAGSRGAFDLPSTTVSQANQIKGIFGFK